MFKKIYNDLKYLLSNDGGYFIAIAMAVAAVAGSMSKKKKAQEAAYKDGELKSKILNSARVRNVDDTEENKRRVIRATQARDIQIERDRIRGESKIDETFAGSGISGGSVDELDAELSAAVAQNKYENKRALDSEIGQLERKRNISEADITAQGTDIGTGPADNTLIENATTAYSGYQTGADISKSFKNPKPKDTKLNKKPSNDLRMGSYLGESYSRNIG